MHHGHAVVDVISQLAGRVLGWDAVHDPATIPQIEVRSHHLVCSCFVPTPIVWWELFLFAVCIHSIQIKLPSVHVHVLAWQGVRQYVAAMYGNATDATPQTKTRAANSKIPEPDAALQEVKCNIGWVKPKSETRNAVSVC